MFNYISSITVENLFGYYNYCIDTTKNDSINELLIIIYGDNGSGKTTILELLFYLVSTADYEGHKTKLKNIIFKKVEIKLNNGMSIVAYRETDGAGAYQFSVNNINNEVINKVEIHGSDEDNQRKINNKNVFDKNNYEDILKLVKNLNLSIHYLSDKRNLLYGFNNMLARNEYRHNIRHNIRHSNNVQILENNDTEDNSLLDSVKDLENWIRQHILLASKAGDRNTNSIYTDLIKKISIPSEEKITVKQLDALIEELISIKKENLAYVKNGFSSKIDIKEIETVISSANTNIELMYHVLEPYINGLRARLDSLRETQDIINLFLSSINDYFSNKTIRYNISSGFKIYHNHNNEPIQLHMLSSGERQLLVLFCHVITSSDKASIFIIDEPEISLNIKWQRKLIDTLLGFTEGRNVQFIFASHSFEVLSEHKNNVYKLINLKK